MNLFPRFRHSLVCALLLTGANAEDKPHPVTEKELRGAATQKVEPEYPAVARQIRLTGDVELEVVVDQLGAVEKVSVVRGNTLLTGPSLQAIRKWKFKPFGTESEPSKATGPIKFSFQM
jgi:periplasmic protein TonB